MAPLSIVKSLKPFQLHEENLNAIQKELTQAKCDFVSIISVMGGYRTGKSFLMDFMMRRLRTLSQTGKKQENGSNAPLTINEMDVQKLPDWIFDGDEQTLSAGDGQHSDKGFGWRGGEKTCTTGIWIWSKPFVFLDQDKRRIGVLLMDTQGAWDGDLDKEQSAIVYGMTALLSSKLIYNIRSNVDDNAMENLDMFTSFAEKACGFTGRAEDDEVARQRKPFGHLELLIRDWQHYDDNWDVQKCKNQMAEHMSHFLNERSEAEGGVRGVAERTVRMNNCFKDITCFGLPHPGIPLTKSSYTGSIAKIERCFLHMLDQFTSKFFGEDFPSPSSPLQIDMTADSFAMTVKNFGSAFTAVAAELCVSLRGAMVNIAMEKDRKQALLEFRSWLEETYPPTVVVDPMDMDIAVEGKKAELLKRLQTSLLPWHLEEAEATAALAEFVDGSKTLAAEAIARNKNQVEAAYTKIIAAPGVALIAYVASLHVYIAGAMAGVMGLMRMQAHARENGTDLLHMDAAQGVIDDLMKFAKERWRDLLAMQVALQGWSWDKAKSHMMAQATAGLNALPVPDKNAGNPKAIKDE